MTRALACCLALLIALSACPVAPPQLVAEGEGEGEGEGEVDAGPVPCNADGVHNEGEECDDGNLTVGDGCDACVVEPDFFCAGGLGVRSVCGERAALCPAGEIVTIPLSFGPTNDVPNGVLRPTQGFARFNDVGGAGLLDVVFDHAGGNMTTESDFLSFSPASELRIRFRRAGTRAPLPMLNPRLVTGDHENSDALGPLHITGWTHEALLPYTLASVFTGEPVEDAGLWRGVVGPVGGFQGDIGGDIDLTGFAVSELRIEPGETVGAAGVRMEGPVAFCAYAGCGDARVEGEGCDDGNRRAGDGCAPDCSIEPGATCACRFPFAVGGDVFETGLLGGPGGGSRPDVDCPAGMWAVGVDGVQDNDDRVRGLQLLCADLSLDDDLALTRDNEERSLFAGNDSGFLDTALSIHRCPDGQVLTALHAELRGNNSLFVNVELGCRELFPDGALGAIETRVFFDGTQSQNGQGTLQSADCGDEGIATGFRQVLAGDSLDQVALACSPVAAPCGTQTSVCVP